ncbi:MAG: hypothetical protein BGP01_00390 [Paludibacter sp. 47-17]|nr:MAG: hypothetical protein BGP01_00390 [Paludibacter sp. 47-17]
MWTAIYDIIDKAGTFIGIIGAIISFLVWLKVKNQSKKLKELGLTLKSINNYSEIQDTFKGITSSNPKAFCLSLISTDASIKTRVNDFIKSQSNLKDMPIVELNMDGLSHETIGTFIDAVRQKRRGELSDATEIHLFIQGPIIAGTLIGSIFDHWVPVKLYHFSNTTHQYEYWGVLAKQ